MRTCQAATVCFATALALAAPPAAAAVSGPGAAEVERAQAQLDAGDFEDAVRTLEGALDQGDVSDDVLVELYRLLGLAHLYLGDEARARDAYEKLLQARPDFELPRSTPPKIRALYERILRDIRQRRVRPVTLEVTPLSDTPGGEPLPMQARILDLPLGARARLHFRRVGAQTYSSVELRRERGEPEGYAAELPAFSVPSEPRPYELEYYVEVADAGGRRLAGYGDAVTPQTLRVTGRAPAPAVQAAAPWWHNPWVWVAGGAVVAGAAAGIVYVATAPQTGQLQITITVRGP